MLGYFVLPTRLIYNAALDLEGQSDDLRLLALRAPGLRPTSSGVEA